LLKKTAKNLRGLLFAAPCRDQELQLKLEEENEGHQSNVLIVHVT